MLFDTTNKKKKYATAYSSLCSYMLMGAIIGLLTGCLSVPNSPYYRSSPENLEFSYEKTPPFSEYLQETKIFLRKHRVFFNSGEAQDLELEQVMPFSWEPEANCQSRVEVSKNTLHSQQKNKRKQRKQRKQRKGVLLIHGMLDTAFALKDIAVALHKRCFMVRSLLLPGHGTRPGDLIGIERQKWRQAVDYGVRSLSEDVEQVFVVGYSLGGLLAVDHSLQHDDVSGLILIAPAIALSYPRLARQSAWIRYLSDWVDIDPYTNPVRYQSVTSDVLAEISKLADEVQEALSEKSLHQPVYLVLSQMDMSVGTKEILSLFSKHMPNPDNRGLLYGPRQLRTQLQPSEVDRRIKFRDTFNKQQKIVSASHVSLPYAPSNPVFGLNSGKRECGLDLGAVSKNQAQACLDDPQSWKGEYACGLEDSYFPIQRMTFQPDFRFMLDEFDAFLQSH